VLLIAVGALTHEGPQSFRPVANGLAVTITSAELLREERMRGADMNAACSLSAAPPWPPSMFS
jgi:hypothetical protein